MTDGLGKGTRVFAEGRNGSVNEFFHTVIEVLVMGKKKPVVLTEISLVQRDPGHLWSLCTSVSELNYFPDVRQTSDHSDWPPILYGFNPQYSFSNRQLVPFSWFRGSDTSKNKTKQKLLIF